MRSSSASWMQSTGQTSMQDLSLRSTQVSVTMYVISLRVYQGARGQPCGCAQRPIPNRKAYHRRPTGLGWISARFSTVEHPQIGGQQVATSATTAWHIRGEELAHCNCD